MSEIIVKVDGKEAGRYVADTEASSICNAHTAVALVNSAGLRFVGSNKVPVGEYTIVQSVHSDGYYGVPLSVMTDSYKAGHFMMYPDSNRMVAYGEFRAPYDRDPSDTRFVCFGMRYLIEKYVCRQWTVEDVNRAEAFYATHNAGNTPYPFPKDLFLAFIEEHNGYFPVRIEALPEGTVANIHVPVYQIFSEGKYSRLITFLETILTQVWYPSTVATNSRRTKHQIEKAFEQSVDEEFNFLINSRLHDFGFRGVTGVEQSVLGGVAHLLNFEGSDTMSACYYAQYVLNNGKPIATSIPATEHSVMTSWPNEKLAIGNMIEKFGGDGKIFACVADSYDYSNCLDTVIPSLAEEHKAKGGLMVIRPDSGDPTQCILDALAAGEKTFGAVENKKGYKVVNNVAAIQGDGINYENIKTILKAVMDAKYSAQNVAFGMGSGLLQKCNRDTMSFATKLSFVEFKDGTEQQVMKKPKTDGGKISFPGALAVRRVNGQLTIFPREEKEDESTNELKTVYNYGPVEGAFDYDFETVRARVDEQWKACDPTYDPVSQELKDKIAAWIDAHNKKFAELYGK